MFKTYFGVLTIRNIIVAPNHLNFLESFVYWKSTLTEIFTEKKDTNLRNY